MTPVKSGEILSSKGHCRRGHVTLCVTCVNVGKKSTFRQYTANCISQFTFVELDDDDDDDDDSNSKLIKGWTQANSRKKQSLSSVNRHQFTSEFLQRICTETISDIVVGSGSDQDSVGYTLEQFDDNDADDADDDDDDSDAERECCRHS